MQIEPNQPTPAAGPAGPQSVVRDKAEFLQARIEKQLAEFGPKIQLNRRNAFRVRMTISALGVAVTVILGLQVSGIQQQLSNIALLLSGTVTLLHALDSFGNYRALWIRYTITENQLRALKSHLEYLLVSGIGSIGEADIDRLYARYSGILEETTEAWLETRQEKATGPS